MDTTRAHDPTSFRVLGGEVIGLLAEHLAAAQARDLPVLPTIRPDELLARWDQPFPRAGLPAERADERLLELLRAVLEQSIHLQHPGYVGHQVALPLPKAGLLELTAALLNNGMAVYEMGQVQTVLERRVVELLAATLGLPETAGGLLTHGGSLGNLTALLAARQARSEHDVWSEGQREPLAVLVSEQAHYCVARAVQVMGWGAGGAQRVATDGAFRLDPADLPRAHQRARDEGRRVVAVVASCCSTATGSFDPVEPIADYCEEHGLWLHVDGAHGASFAFSAAQRGRLSGVERADSVVWDLHKMMGLPALSTAVLYRDDRRSTQAFAQDAAYLFDADAAAARERPWYDLGTRTLECTKRSMGVTAYCMLQVLGTDWFGAQVDALVERTRWFETLLEAATDFELAHRPQANILCFRHVLEGEPAAERDLRQERLREVVLEEGSYYLVQTRLRGALWLRVTLMNPATTRADLEGLLASLRRAAEVVRARAAARR